MKNGNIVISMIIKKENVLVRFRDRRGLATYMGGFILSFLLILTAVFLVVKYTHKLPGIRGFKEWSAMVPEEANGPGTSAANLGETSAGVPEDLQRLKMLQQKIAEERRKIEQERQELLRKERWIEAEMKRLQATRAEIEKQANRLKDERIQRLARIFSSMRPEQAASIGQNLDDSTLIQILMTMREREAAKVLSSIEPDRAARISHKLGILELPSGR